MRTWRKRIIKWCWILIAFLVTAVIVIVKILPLLPDEELADSDLIPVYQAVAAEENPLPALQLAFEAAESGQGIDHSGIASV